MRNIIEVENVTKKFGTFVALDDISFESQEGDIVAFLGPNGAGKTTTMRIITSFIPATSGTVRVDGNDIFDDSFKVRELIGYLPEIPPLYPDMTVQSFLRYVAEIKQVAPREITHRVNIIMGLCGLEHMRERLIFKLSRGYKQRVGIAQAIIHDPKVIILDEPTVGLDPNQVIEIRDLINEMAENKSVLLSTHILSEAEALCKHVVIINKGKIAGKGLWSEMSEKLQEKLVLGLVFTDFDNAKVEKIKQLNGVTDLQILEDKAIKVYCHKSSGVKAELIRLIADNNWDIETLISEKMSLEEVFRTLTEEKEGVTSESIK